MKSMIKQGGMFGEKFWLASADFKLIILAVGCLGFFYWPAKVYSAEPTTILINEVAWMGTTESANNEWLELRNQTDQAIDLTGWTLKAISGSPNIILKGTIEASGYFLLERTDDNSVPQVTADQIYVGALSNAGADLFLSDSQGNPVDQLLAASQWPAGDNLTKLTMERGDDDSWHDSQAVGGTPRANNYRQAIIIGGSNTGAADTSTSGTSNTASTSQATNSVVIQNNQSTNSTSTISLPVANYDLNADLVISEILPNPQGDDKAGEFIELYNQSNRPVNPYGWKLTIGSKSYQLLDQALPPGGYLAVYRSLSGLTLTNSSSSVALLAPLQALAKSSVSYGQVKESQSYALAADGNWYWTSIITPGSQNRFDKINHPPKAVFSVEGDLAVAAKLLFDSSDSQDEDNDQLSFLWSFGDQRSSTLPSPDHRFDKAGSYIIKLTVDDGQASTSLSKTIKILAAASSSAAKNRSVTSTPAVVRSSISINELLPSPEGADVAGEWIELYNQGTEKLNLADWQLDDAPGGSKPYVFPEDLWLNAKGYLKVSRTESGLALNNDQDSIRLFDDNNELIDQVDYVGAKTGLAYAKINNQWVWTKSATPGQMNILVKADLAAKSAPAKTKTSTKQVLGTKILSSQSSVELAGLMVGDQVSVRGVVLVKPGVLGAQIFYIATPRGLQIYNYHKDFPDLTSGDLIEVKGEVAESNGEKRLKTSSLEAIKIIGRTALPEPLAFTCDKVDEESLGQLISLSGEITKKSGSTIYLDDGTDEALVYVKTSAAIDKKEIKVGDRFKVVGIVNQTKSGVRVLPRNTADFVRLDQPDIEVLGETASSSQWSIPARDKKIEFLQYLLVIAVGIIFVLLGVAIKFRKKLR